MHDGTAPPPPSTEGQRPSGCGEMAETGMRGSVSGGLRVGWQTAQTGGERPVEPAGSSAPRLQLETSRAHRCTPSCRSRCSSPQRQRPCSRPHWPSARIVRSATAAAQRSRSTLGRTCDTKGVALSFGCTSLSAAGFENPVRSEDGVGATMPMALLLSEDKPARIREM